MFMNKDSTLVNLSFGLLHVNRVNFDIYKKSKEGEANLHCRLNSLGTPTGEQYVQTISKVNC